MLILHSQCWAKLESLITITSSLPVNYCRNTSGQNSHFDSVINNTKQIWLYLNHSVVDPTEQTLITEKVKHAKNPCLGWKMGFNGKVLASHAEDPRFEPTPPSKAETSASYKEKMLGHQELL